MAALRGEAIAQDAQPMLTCQRVVTKREAMSHFTIAVAAALFALVHSAACASAQSYPQRTVKFIIPFGPGSGSDIAARLVGDKLAARWGKPVVVESRPGGDGLISINAFVSANDDHTLLFVPVGLFAVHPFSHAKLPYDADRDLVPIVNITAIVLSMTTPASMKLKSAAEFVALARAQPGKLNAAAAQGTSDFLLTGFLKSNNLQVAKVPYRDIMQGPNDLAENRIQMLMSSITIVQSLQKAGKLNILAVTSSKRAPSAPDVPTAAEAGFPVLEMDSLIGVFGPRGMPLETRARIAADVKAVVDADPSIATKLLATGQVMDIRGPAEFAAGIKETREKLTAIAKQAGIKPPQ
jgi:tripartite-type tricarboxylate transporter receptor subunit TctC